MKGGIKQYSISRHLDRSLDTVHSPLIQRPFFELSRDDDDDDDDDDDFYIALFSALEQTHCARM